MKSRIITSFCLSLIITSFVAFILSQTGIREWVIMSFITLAVATMLIIGVMYCTDEEK